jgi:hypothetical protein
MMIGSRVFRPRYYGRALPGAALLAAGLLAGSLPAPAAHAAIGGCRSDPIVLLSNGDILDLSANIDDSVTDIQQVTYTLHGPAGNSVTGVIPTSGVLGPKETFQYTADGAAGSYGVETVVSTLTPHVDVTATAQAIGLLWSDSATAQGWSLQPLRVALAR